jgi:nicotinate-nucleotide adenylyltransferase
MDKKKTVALYGGSFDPPHIAHEAIVTALSTLDFIDKVVIMPTYLNPFKESFTTPPEVRLAWLKEIFAENDKVEVSSYEVDQQRSVATIESVEHLLRCYDKLYLVIGADNLQSLHKWHAYEKLLKKATFIVASRDNIKVPDRFIKLDINEDISSSRLRKELDISKLPKKRAKEIAQYYKEHNAKQN